MKPTTSTAIDFMGYRYSARIGVLTVWQVLKHRLTSQGELLELFLRNAVMRFGINIIIPVCIGFLTLTILVRRLFSFIQIFLEHAGPAITQLEVVGTSTSPTPPGSRPQHIPKLIHQVYHSWGSSPQSNGSNDRMGIIPADWQEARQTCMKLNKGWEIKVGFMSVELVMTGTTTSARSDSGSSG